MQKPKPHSSTNTKARASRTGQTAPAPDTVIAGSGFTDLDFLDADKIATNCMRLQKGLNSSADARKSLRAREKAAWQIGTELWGTADAIRRGRDRTRLAAIRQEHSQGTWGVLPRALRGEQVALPYGRRGAVFVSAKGRVLVARIAEVHEPVEDRGGHNRVLIKTAVLLYPTPEGRVPAHKNVHISEVEVSGEPAQAKIITGRDGIHIALPNNDYQSDVLIWRNQQTPDSVRKAALERSIAIVTHSSLEGGKTESEVYYPLDTIRPVGQAQTERSRTRTSSKLQKSLFGQMSKRKTFRLGVPRPLRFSN